MANTTTTKKTTSKASATKEETISTEELLTTIKSLKDEIDALKSEQPKVAVLKDSGLSSRRIKVVSCVHCWLNLTTEENGKGTKFEFPKFGYQHNIRYDVLEKCVHNHRACAERGDFYICDPEAVADLGLGDCYQNLYNADEINDIIHFKNGEVDVDKIVGMAVYDSYREEYTDTTTRDNAIQTIAENIANGETYDLNLIDSLSKKTGVDINKIVEQIKAIANKSKK